MTDKEPIRCQDCEHHKCYYGADGQDCSCALSVFVTPTTNKPPSNCPLLHSGLLKEMIEPSKIERELRGKLKELDYDRNRTN